MITLPRVICSFRRRFLYGTSSDVVRLGGEGFGEPKAPRAPVISLSFSLRAPGSLTGHPRIFRLIQRFLPGFRADKVSIVVHLPGGEDGRSRG